MLALAIGAPLDGVFAEFLEVDARLSHGPQLGRTGFEPDP
jgi:hypothetical protein